jgi:DNA-3-methyladenine glycosylase
MKKLGIQFYNRKDVVSIARELIGKTLVTRIGGITTSETEAYIGITDRASHSFRGRRSAKNEHMYAGPGTAYVYICYGIHHLFNVVTNKTGVPDAVLIRALEPVKGITAMLKRTGKEKPDHTLTKGPGNVGRAMGISKMHSGIPLTGDIVFITEKESPGKRLPPDDLIGCSRRIGVESAGEAADLPYRFYLKGNKYVSGYPTK